MEEPKTNKPANGSPVLFRSFLVIAISWTILIALLLGWSLKHEKNETEAIILNESRSLIKLLMTMRYWNSLHGGVYVPVSKGKKVNPFLDGAESEVITRDGRKLALVNPEYMTHEIAQIASQRSGVQFHITSLNLLNSHNAPEEWEVRALKSFSAKGRNEYFEWAPAGQREQHIFRYMAPLWTEAPCLKCHARQGYVEGDLRGGISVLVPASEILSAQRNRILVMAFGYLIVWMIGLSGVYAAFRVIKRDYRERSDLIERLQAAANEVRTLKGFIPICASCKKVRTDEGYWEQIEKYIKDRSEAEFSHGICPECEEALYPDIVKRRKSNKDSEKQ
jgi:hypothetical protein